MGKQPNPRLSKVYTFLSDKNIKNFPQSEEDFGNRMSSDPELSGKVFDFLSKQNVQNLPSSHDEFVSSLGLKKKDTTSAPLSPSSQEPDPSSVFRLTPGQQADFDESLRPKESTLFTDNKVKFDEKRLREGLGVDEKPVSLTDRIGTAAGNFNKGVIKTFSSLPKAIAIGAQKLDKLTGVDRPIEDYATFQAGEWVDKKALELGITATNPDVSSNFIEGTIPSALGTVMGLMLTGGSGQAEKIITAPAGILGNTAKEVGKFVTSAPAVTGGSMMGVQEFENAKANGATDEEAFDVFAKNYAIGQTEVIPLARALDRINKFTGGSLANVIKAGAIGSLEEGTQEGVQQYLTNKVAQGSYDPKREPFKDMIESVGAGMFVGFILPGVGAAMQAMTPEQRAETKSTINEALKTSTENTQAITAESAVNEPVAEQVNEPGQPLTASPVLDENGQTTIQENPEVTPEQFIDEPNTQTQSENQTPEAQEQGDPLPETGKSERNTEEVSASPEAIPETTSFTPAEVINRDYAKLKTKLGDKKAKKYFDQADKLVNPNQNEIVEYRENGIVTKEGDKYTFHAIADTDLKNWRAGFTQDVTDQFLQSSKEPEQGQNVNENALVSETGVSNDLIKPQQNEGPTIPVQDQRSGSDSGGTEQGIEETQQEESSSSLPSKENDSPGAYEVGQEVEYNRFGLKHRGKIVGIAPDGKLMVDTNGTKLRFRPDEIGPNTEHYETASGAVTVRPDKKGTNAFVGNVQSGVGLSFDFTGHIGKTGKWIKKYLTPKGLLPQSTFDLANKSQMKVAKELSGLKFLVSDLEKAGKPYLKTEQDWKNVNDVLAGTAPLSSLPTPLAEVVQKMDATRTRLQQELIDSGAIQGELKQTVEDSKGSYLNRSYQVHSDPEGYREWLENSPEGQAVRNKAVAFIRSQNTNLSEDRIEGMINELISKPDAPLAILKGGKLGSKDIGILKSRQDIAEPIRELMGEYADPRVTFSKSVLKMTNLIAHHNLLEQIKKDGLGTYLFEESFGKFATQIASDGSQTMSPLNGLYTSPDIAKSFSEWNQKASSGNGLIGFLMDWLVKLNGLASYSKTVLSTSTHARNLWGSATIALANGHLFDSYGHWSKSAKSTTTNWLQLSSEQQRTEIARLTELGVIGDSNAAGFLRDITSDINKSFEDPTMYSLNKYKRLSGKVLGVINRAYAAEDEVFKALAFYNEVDRYSNAYKEELASGQMTPEQVDQKAAEIVRKTFPTYSLTPKGIQMLRRFPFVASFPTFTAEMIRTTYNTVQLAKQELSDPKTRSIGVKRTTGLLAAASSTYLLAMASKAMLGVGDDEDEALKSFDAPWAKGGQKIYLEKGDKKYKYIDMSYSDPYAFLKRPINGLLSGVFDDDVKIRDAAIESAAGLLAPFMDEGMLTARGIDVFRNKREDTGAQIYNPEASTGDQAQDVYKYMSGAFEPGTIRSLKRLHDAYTGADVTEQGKEINTDEELLFMLGGQRIETKDIPQAYSYAMRSIKSRLSHAENIYDFEKYKKRGSTDESKAEAFEKSKEALKSVLDDARKQFKDGTTLGMTPTELGVIMYQSKLKPAYIGYIRGFRDDIPINH